jgi:hypothetical protein
MMMLKSDLKRGKMESQYLETNKMELTVLSIKKMTW